MDQELNPEEDQLSLPAIQILAHSEQHFVVFRIKTFNQITLYTHTSCLANKFFVPYSIKSFRYI